MTKIRPLLFNPFENCEENFYNIGPRMKNLELKSIKLKSLNHRGRIWKISEMRCNELLANKVIPNVKILGPGVIFTTIHFIRSIRMYSVS
jgi:hypothetical protein